MKITFSNTVLKQDMAIISLIIKKGILHNRFTNLIFKFEHIKIEK